MKRSSSSAFVVPLLVIIGAGIAGSSGCSSKAGSGAPGAGGAGGDSPPSGTVGDSYPAGPYGVGVGKVVENAEFLGHQTFDEDPNQLSRVSLGNYYNPDGTKLTSAGVPVTAILLTVGAVWCNPCVQEAKVLGAVADKFMPAGVQVLQDLYQGADATTGVAATRDELNRWVSTHQLPFPVFIDPAKKLARYFDVSSLPFIMLLDPKTMVALSEEVGFGGQPALEAFICDHAPEKLSVCPVK